MNSYLILCLDGSTQKVSGDFYEGEDGDYVFLAGQEEDLRANIALVASVSKSR